MATADDGLSGNLRFSPNIPVKPLILSPCECTYGGYYGLVVVTPLPRLRPQTFHRSHDNLNCFHILYAYWYRWENSWEARWGRSDYLWATQGPPNSQKCTFVYIVAHIWKNWQLCFSLVIHMSALWWGLTALQFSFTWVQHKGPPNMKKNHILGLNLNISCQIVSLFYMNIYMCERIAGKQDRPSLVNEDPLRAP